ncbi:unnamed protein product [Caenorhabditis nigoni]
MFLKTLILLLMILSCGVEGKQEKDESTEFSASMETCVVLVIISFLFGIATAFFLLRKEMFQTNNCQHCTNTRLGLNAVDPTLEAKNGIIDSCKRMVLRVRSLVYDLLDTALKVLNGNDSLLFEDIKYEMYFAVFLITCGTAAVVMNQFNNMAQENYLESFLVALSSAGFPSASAAVAYIFLCIGKKQPFIRVSFLTIMIVGVLADWKYADYQMVSVQSFGAFAFGVIMMDLMMVYGPHVPEFDIWMSGILIYFIFLTFSISLIFLALVCDFGSYNMSSKIKAGYIFFSIGALILSLIRIRTK